MLVRVIAFCTAVVMFWTGASTHEQLAWLQGQPAGEAARLLVEADDEPGSVEDHHLDDQPGQSTAKNLAELPGLLMPAEVQTSPLLHPGMPLARFEMRPLQALYLEGPERPPRRHPTAA